jgi:hypothetical protein
MRQLVLRVVAVRIRPAGVRLAGWFPLGWACDIVQRGADPTVWRDTAVNCQKGKPIRKAKPGDFRCKECGFVSAKKKKLCEPKRVKK